MTVPFSADWRASFLSEKDFSNLWPEVKVRLGEQVHVARYGASAGRRPTPVTPMTPTMLRPGMTTSGPSVGIPDWFARDPTYKYAASDWEVVAMTYKYGTKPNPDTFESVFGKYALDQMKYRSEYRFSARIRPLLPLGPRASGGG